MTIKLTTLCTLIYLLLGSLTAQGSFQTIDSQPFQKVQGGLASPGQLMSKIKPEGYLISFWANWCAPCKKELKMLAQKKDFLKRFPVVLINVDEDDAWPKALAFLESIDWNGPMLRDPGGSWFFAHDSTGALPANLLLTGNGQLLKQFAQIHEDTLTQIPKLIEKKQIGHWEFNQVSLYKQVDKQTNTIDHPEILALSNAIGWKKRDLSFFLTHNALTRKASDKWEKEDEIGFSWLQWYPDQQIQLRLGDGMIVWQEGNILSLRHDPDTDSASSLRGGHFTYFKDQWSFDAVTGIARDRLYPFYPDPENDVSVTLPEERINGFRLQGPLFTGAWSGSFQIMGVSYRRQSDTKLGYPSSAEDLRSGAAMHWEGPGFNLHMSHSGYDIEGRTAEPAHSAKIGFSWNMITTPSWSLTLPVQSQEIFGLPPRTQTTTLINGPFIPLEDDHKQTVGVSPRLAINDIADIEIKNINENGLLASKVSSNNRNSRTTTISVETSKGTSLLIGQQLHVDDSQDNMTKRMESALQLGWDPIEHIHAQILIKQRQNSTTMALLNGGGSTTNIARFSKNAMVDQTAGLNEIHISSNMKHWLPALTGWADSMNLEVSSTEQNAYYQTVSGLEQNRLASVRVILGWSDTLTIRSAMGQERGGVVCSGGICSNRPPLNGVEVSSRIKLKF